VRVSTGLQSAQRTAWLISYTPATDEPRLVRQARTLLERGWRVVVCGYAGRDPVPAGWTFVDLRAGMHQSDSAGLALRRRIGHRLLRSGVPAGADLYISGAAAWRGHRQAIMQTARNRPDLRPSLVIAHDYPTCPAGWVLAHAFGARLVVDSHEYMLEARPEDPDWTLHERPLIKATQDKYLARADQVLTVSEGIARRLNAEQSLKRPVAVIRNMPFYQRQPFRATSGEWTILYHGIIDQARNLEPAIEAAALWKAPARLVLRGPCSVPYKRHLLSLIEQRGLRDRARIADPIAPELMISEANTADIGYFVYADGSTQRRYALPNKFFEYVMAGLALCISDLPEMTTLLKRYNLGLTVSGIEPVSIARAVDQFRPELIDQFKSASLSAAQELCWDQEQNRFIEIIEEQCKTP
jgi:glycogen(starch) synthase